MNYTLNEEARITEEFTCHACKDLVDGCAALDPCEIEDELYCDSCSSDLTYLRLEGFISKEYQPKN